MTLTSRKHADEVRQMWQCRALAEADGKLQRVLMIALAKEYTADMLVLLKVAFGTVEIPMPFYSGYATIVDTGHIVCMMHDRRIGVTYKGVVPVYDSENEFLLHMRRLADRLKLSDAERIDMFRVLKKWITRDERVGIEGEKLAS